MTTNIVMVRTGNVNDIARLARLLRGTANTLVLSAGGARGFAHLGVIRALREPRVPIDLIGCSMGSIVGAAVLAKAWAVQRRGCVKSLGPGNFCAVTAPE